VPQGLRVQVPPPAPSKNYLSKNMNKIILILIGLLIVGGVVALFYLNDKDLEEKEEVLNEEMIEESEILEEKDLNEEVVEETEPQKEEPEKQEEAVVIKKQKVGTLWEKLP
jgi:hypothetical protein